MATPLTDYSLGNSSIGSHSSSRGRAMVVWGFLLGYLLLLCYLGGAGFARALGGLSLGQLQDTMQLKNQLGQVAISALLEVARFLLAGILVALALGPAATWRRWIAKTAVALVLSLALTVLLGSLQRGAVIPGWSLILPALGCLGGAWMGSLWTGGVATRCFLLAQILLLPLFILGSAAGLVFWVAEKSPTASLPPTATAAEKKRLVDLIQDSVSDQEHGVEAGHLRLTERDFNLLLGWALAVGSGDHRAEVRLEPQSCTARASLEIPIPLIGRRYLNLDAAGQFSVGGGRPRLRVASLQIGPLRVPAWLLQHGVPRVVSVIGERVTVRQAFGSIESLQLRSDAVEVVIRQEQFSSELLPKLLMLLGAHPEVREATQAQVAHLLSVAEQLAAGDERFEGLLRASMQLARDRSQTGDAVQENRAAIFALAILLGHQRVEDLVGPVLDASQRQVVQQRVGRVPLRGRTDWTKHFWVSAALALLSNQRVSDAIGLLKEEADAGEGGSGFSFADLMADRAGILFALAATRDEGSARELQARLCGDFALEDLFPPAADLPEGISDAELQQRYGGVGGPAFRQVEWEIERRLGRCTLLQ